MGCDIHVYVEKKVDNAWKPVAGPNPYFGKYARMKKMVYPDWAYWGRDYPLFTVLANVRRAEVDSKINALSEPRGLPEDVSASIARNAQNVYMHSFSYFTLPELLEARDQILEVSEEFAQDTIGILERLSEGDPESVRAVFWFDN